MKTLLFSLGALCILASACSKDQPAKPAETGTVGKGLGGQTVGTPFAGSVGAGNSETRGGNVAKTATGQQ